MTIPGSLLQSFADPMSAAPWTAPPTSGTGADATNAQHVPTPQSNDCQSGGLTTCVWQVSLPLVGCVCFDKFGFGFLAIMVILLGIAGVIL